MMKIYQSIICIFTVLVSISTSAQEENKLLEGVKCSISEPYSTINGKKKDYFKVANDLIAIKFGDEKKIVLQKFKLEDMSLEQMNRLDFNTDKNHIEKIEVLNGRMFIFYSRFVKKGKIEQLFFQEVDLRVLAFKGSEEKLIETTKRLKSREFKLGGYRYETTDKYTFKKSRDESKLLIYYRVEQKKGSNKAGEREVDVYVFNSGLKSVWTKNIKIPYSKNKVWLLNSLVSEEGDVYFGAITHKGEKTVDKSIVEVLKYSKNGEKRISLDINNSKKIGKVLLRENFENEIVFAAFYSSRLSHKDSKGFFIAKLTKEIGKKSEKEYDIPLSIIQRYSGESETLINEEKGKSAFGRLKKIIFRELLFFNNGEILLIAEQLSFSSYSSGGIYYIYDNIIITKIDDKGELNWMNVIPKKQMMSFRVKTFNFNNSLESYDVFFVDHIGNKNLKENEVPKLHADNAGGFLTVCKLDKNTGDFRKETLLDFKDVKGIKTYQFYPEKVLFVDKNILMFEVYKKKKEDVFIQIEY